MSDDLQQSNDADEDISPSPDARLQRAGSEEQDAGGETAAAPGSSAASAQGTPLFEVLPPDEGEQGYYYDEQPIQLADWEQGAIDMVANGIPWCEPPPPTPPAAAAPLGVAKVPMVPRLDLSCLQADGDDSDDNLYGDQQQAAAAGCTGSNNNDGDDGSGCHTSARDCEGTACHASCDHPHAPGAAADGYASEEPDDAEYVCRLPPPAPSDEGRFHIYRPLPAHQLRAAERLVASVADPCQAAQVAAIWRGLLQARHNCELLVGRSVRILKEVSRDAQAALQGAHQAMMIKDQTIDQLFSELVAQQQAAAAAQQAAAATGREGDLVALSDALARENEELVDQVDELQQSYAEARQAYRRLQRESQAQLAAAAAEVARLTAAQGSSAAEAQALRARVAELQARLLATQSCGGAANADTATARLVDGQAAAADASQDSDLFVPETAEASDPCRELLEEGGDCDEDACDDDDVLAAAKLLRSATLA